MGEVTFDDNVARDDLGALVEEIHAQLGSGERCTPARNGLFITLRRESETAEDARQEGVLAVDAILEKVDRAWSWRDIRIEEDSGTRHVCQLPRWIPPRSVYHCFECGQRWRIAELVAESRRGEDVEVGRWGRISGE
ncbi:MAG: hypothetical protein ACRDI0_08915 [Actinomycetota bacterium]